VRPSRSSSCFTALRIQARSLSDRPGRPGYGSGQEYLREGGPVPLWSAASGLICLGRIPRSHRNRQRQSLSTSFSPEPLLAKARWNKIAKRRFPRAANPRSAKPPAPPFRRAPLPPGPPSAWPPFRLAPFRRAAGPQTPTGGPLPDPYRPRGAPPLAVNRRTHLHAVVPAAVEALVEHRVVTGPREQKVGVEGLLGVREDEPG
jgi:hypothetical protein